MRIESLLLAAACCLASAALPRTAAAQPLDQLGNRAAAIGAFVAVADDASAVAWNPSALINGPLFNVLLDFGQATSEDDFEQPTRPAGRSGSTFLSLATLPLGISYYRGRLTQLSPAAQQPLSRQVRQVSVRSLSLSQVGVTVLQSIAEGFTVGATAKLVRGSLASGLASLESWDDGYEIADRLEDEGRTTADVDVGLTAGSGRVRLGLVARNLAAPTFEADGDSWQLQRHVRAGAAWGDRWPGTPRLIVAVDADLTTVEGVGGERRDLAVGGERWFRNGAVAIRGGLRASTLGRSRPLASAGASYAVRSGIYIDAMAAAGRDGDRRWGIAGRLSY